MNKKAEYNFERKPVLMNLKTCCWLCFASFRVYYSFQRMYFF